MLHYYKQLISSLYVAVYGRAPDNSGLQYWAQELHNGNSYQQIANGFVEHPLFNHFYGGLNHGDLVRSFYENILGGEGDLGGVQHWTNQLNSGQSVAAVLSSFLESALTIDLSTQGSLTYEEWQSAIERQNILTNKADTGVYYAEYLGKGSDMLGDIWSLDIMNDPHYINAKKIIEGITSHLSSVEGAKHYIQTNYEKDDSWSNSDGWGDLGDAWLWVWLAALLDGEWTGDWSQFDNWDGQGGTINQNMFDGLDWDASEGDFGWLFGEGNWDGDWGTWFEAYASWIIAWLGALEGLDWSGQWATNMSDMDWGAEPMAASYGNYALIPEDIELVGHTSNDTVDIFF